jgi:NADH-quinone oxidoreductase subunit F
MKTRFKVGMSSCGISAGADKVYEKLKDLVSEQQDISVELTGCIGFCYAEPLVEIVHHGKSNFYSNVDEQKIEEIYNSISENNFNETKKFIFTDIKKENYSIQKRIVLRNCGVINPVSIEDYFKVSGYKSLEKTLKEMTPEKVISEIKDSGLRGRGGAGFPTGIKWELAYNNKSDSKYIICNADEGDPGAFMDRSVLEGDPHSVIEGMIIAGYAIGANNGYIYCRAEYPLAIERLKIAIKAAEKNSLLGDNILNTGFSFNIKIKEGAGAFVCGEETALIQSIEGKRGMPKFRPPYPAAKGLFDKPTNINNVETLANVAWIILNGAESYAALGHNKSKGTKVFALTGKIKNPGLIEVEMGMPLKDIIFKIGGGIINDNKFKAVQLGGPSGGCLPYSLIDTPVSYENLVESGAIMGSGGMVVMDDSTCMVDVAKYFLNFTKDESCGKCTFCRIGTKRLLEILEKITNGDGELSDINKLEELSNSIKMSSLCGLGQTSPNPVLTTLKYFKDEFIAHITEKKCPAKVCKSLITFTINDDKCIKCGLCQKNCPVDTIEGKIKEYFTIIQKDCIKCGKCKSVCPVSAVDVQ